MTQILRHAGLSAKVVLGGADRQESVCRGLAAVNPKADYIAIHDGARPLVNADLIKRVVAYARNTDGAIPAVPVTDSLRKISENGVSSEAVDRSLYRAVQTPQAFSLWRLREAYSLPYDEAFTDDIVLVEGSSDNIKITTPLDMAVAEARLSMDKA